MAAESASVAFLFEFVVLLLDRLQETKAKAFGFFDLLNGGSTVERLERPCNQLPLEMEGYIRYMQVHWLVTLLAGVMFDKARAATLDLYLAVGFLLDVLDVDALMADHLRAKVEPGDEFKVDRDFLFGPFPLVKFSSVRKEKEQKRGSRLPFQGGRARPVQAREGGGTGARQQGLEAPVSSALRSWQWPPQGLPSSCA